MLNFSKLTMQCINAANMIRKFNIISSLLIRERSAQVSYNLFYSILVSSVLFIFLGREQQQFSASFPPPLFGFQCLFLVHLVGFSFSILIVYLFTSSVQSQLTLPQWAGNCSQSAVHLDKVRTSIFGVSSVLPDFVEVFFPYFNCIY